MGQDEIKHRFVFGVKNSIRGVSFVAFSEKNIVRDLPRRSFVIFFENASKNML